MENFGKHSNFVEGRADELRGIENVCPTEKVMS